MRDREIVILRETMMQEEESEDEEAENKDGMGAGSSKASWIKNLHCPFLSETILPLSGYLVQQFICPQKGGRRGVCDSYSER